MARLRSVQPHARGDGSIWALDLELGPEGGDHVEVEAEGELAVVRGTLDGAPFALPGRHARSGRRAEPLRGEAARLLARANAAGPVADLTEALREPAQAFVDRVRGHVARATGRSARAQGRRD